MAFSDQWQTVERLCQLSRCRPAAVRLLASGTEARLQAAIHFKVAHLQAESLRYFFLTGECIEDEDDDGDADDRMP